MDDTITVRLPKKLREKLRKLSRREKVNMSELVRESLEQYISLREFRRLRKKVLPFAEAQGMLTDEDIFRSIS